MQSTVLVELVAEALRDAGEDTPVPPLIAALAQVPDPRRRQGRRYPLPFLWGALVLAVLCTCNTLEAVGQWGAEQHGLLAAHFPGQRFHTPTGALYRRLLPRLSVAHLEAALATWVGARVQADADAAVALDGKTVRGAAPAGGTAPHLLSIATHDSGDTLLQVHVSEKPNEIPVAREVLPVLSLAGRVVTADALHTNRTTAQAILDQEADYLLVVKANQPTLDAACAAYFAAATARVGRATTIGGVAAPRRALCTPRRTSTRT